MMINVHSHVSNLGSLEVSETVTRSNLLRGLVKHRTCSSPAHVRFLLSLSTFPSITSWVLLGSSPEELSGTEGDTVRETDPVSWSLVISARHEAAPGSLMPRNSPNQGGQTRSLISQQQVPAVYLKMVANIWYNCLRKRSNKAACSSIAE